MDTRSRSLRFPSVRLGPLHVVDPVRYHRLPQVSAQQTSSNENDTKKTYERGSRLVVWCHVSMRRTSQPISHPRNQRDHQMRTQLRKCARTSRSPHHDPQPVQYQRRCVCRVLSRVCSAQLRIRRGRRGGDGSSRAQRPDETRISRQGFRNTRALTDHIVAHSV